MPRVWNLVTLTLAFAASLFPPAALASMPCPSAPCDPFAVDSYAMCARKADWIVEGEVASVTHGTKFVRGVTPIRMHQNLDGSFSVRRDVVDFPLWDGGQVVLTKIQVIKGVVEANGRKMTVRAASHCWMREAYIHEGQIGYRVRVYGTENELTSEVLGPLLTAGSFAVLVLDGDKEQLVERVPPPLPEPVR